MKVKARQKAKVKKTRVSIPPSVPKIPKPPKLPDTDVLKIFESYERIISGFFDFADDPIEDNEIQEIMTMVLQSCQETQKMTLYTMDLVRLGLQSDFGSFDSFRPLTSNPWLVKVIVEEAKKRLMASAEENESSN